MRRGVVGLTVAAALLLTGCSHMAAPTPPPADAAATAQPSLDPKAEPAVAVLALTPKSAASVAVTDFDQVRIDLGLPDVTDASSPAEQKEFWQRADAERPMLTDGLLRPYDAQLGSTYGFTSLDVAWEAQFRDGDGHPTGWVVGFRDGTDLQAVQRAVSAGAAPLAGAQVDAAHGLVTTGSAPDPSESWAADPDASDLVADTAADSTLLAAGCDAGASSAGSAGSGGLDELQGWSVAFQDTLATARLGVDRTDLFTRMRLGDAQPKFKTTYADGVADPGTGRIGYVMTDPKVAARLALAGRLPFAACS